MDSTLGAKFFRAAEFDQGWVDFWRSPDEADRWSYARLLNDSLLVAGALQRRGLRKNDRVAMVLPTHPDFYRAFFGILLAGAVPSALYPPIRLGRTEAWGERTRVMLKALGCRAVLTDVRLLQLLRELSGNETADLGALSVQDLIGEAQPGSYVERKSCELAYIQFSSGTTGTPKPIALTHANILSNATAILESFPGDLSEHSGLSWLPLYHDMGLIGFLISAMLASARLTLIPPERFVARPRIWLEALTQTQATISAAPNFAYSLCIDRIAAQDLEGLDLSNWRIAFCGAETVYPETLEAFTKQFASVGFDPQVFTPVYGLAEATLAVTMSEVGRPPLFTHFNQLDLEGKGLAVEASEGPQMASLGQPVGGVAVEIRDPSGIKLPDARVGHVWVRGPGVMREYLNLPTQTRKTIPDGWLDTGDRGFFYQRELYLCGRAKDAVIIRGRNYDPAQIEHSITGIGGLRPGRVAAFGSINRAMGTENLVVLAECSNRRTSFAERSRLETELVEVVQQNHNLRVSELVLLPPNTLPRTSSGKIRRGAARLLWEKGELPTAADPRNTASRVVE